MATVDRYVNAAKTISLSADEQTEAYEREQPDLGRLDRHIRGLRKDRIEIQ